MRHSSRSRKPRGQTRVKTESFSLKGGLNLVDAPLTIPQGMCLSAVNYELLTNDGYRRSDGYERSDGQPRPSDASYWILNYDAGVTDVSEGDVVTGGTSGATGKALIDGVGTTASGYLVLTAVVGTFQDDEDLEVSAAKVSEANGAASQRGAPTQVLDATYAQDAIETQRALIGKVGAGNASGPVRGVHVYQGVNYAFRDNTGATACLMWKQTASGWVEQSLGNRIPFTDGGAGVEYVEGEVITGTTSGASATIARVVLQSGTWGTDAVGYFIIGAVTAGPFQAEATTGSISGAVPIDSAEIANTLQPGGRFECVNFNFRGSSLTKRMYGVDGVSPAFEWDGSVFVPILTGNTTDTPFHLEINEFHLMLVFQNGSLQNSATGEPYVWSGGGAAEIGVGHPIVGLEKEVGGAMAILCRNKTFALFGKNTVGSPWDLQTVSDESGGIEWTMQRLGRTRYLDDSGFVSMDAVQEYGSFSTTTYSQVIEPLVSAKKELATASIIVRRKTQLRTYFSDGTAIVATFRNKKLSGFTTQYYKNAAGDPIPVRCTANGEDANGSEILFFGSDDGYVYQMDSGTSFDGDPVVATFILAYTHLGYPSYDKQMKKVVVDADGASGAVISYAAKLEYSAGEVPGGLTFSQIIAAIRAYWNEVFWNNFSWSAEDVSRVEGAIDGVGRNISLQISSTGTYVQPHTLFSITYHYIVRKLVR